MIPPDANNCVTLDGILFDEIGVGQVLFNKIERICPAVGKSKAAFTKGELHKVGNKTPPLPAGIGLLNGSYSQLQTSLAKKQKQTMTWSISASIIVLNSSSLNFDHIQGR